MTSSETLLVVAAVKEELHWLSSRLRRRKEKSLGPHCVTIGWHRNGVVALLVAGAGTVNTAGSLGAIIPALRPRGVLLCGCGGAYPGWELAHGDVVFATEEIAPQLGVEPDRKEDPTIPLPFLPNRIQLDVALVRRGREALLLDGLFPEGSVQSGPFVTISTVTASTSTGEGYRRLYGALVENMEGFAAATICQRYALPLLEVRSISNMVGERNRSLWNLDLAFRRGQEAVLTLLEKGVIP
jgi:futalosine hydrolase